MPKVTTNVFLIAMLIVTLSFGTVHSAPPPASVATQAGVAPTNASPADTDYLLLYNAAQKRLERVAWSSLPSAEGGSDSTAIHDNVAGEINAIAQEGSALEDGDALVGENAQNSYAKIKILLSELYTYVAGKLLAAYPNLDTDSTNDITAEADPIVKAVNGIVKSNGSTISAASAGTDYLAPNGSAASLTSFPTLNQNTTGTAAALAANGSNCSAGYAPLGVDAAGAVESCWQVTPAAIGAQTPLSAGTDYLAPNGNGSQLTNLPLPTYADNTLLDLSAITMSSTNAEGLALPYWANTTPGTDKRYFTWDDTANVVKIWKDGVGWITINPSAGAPTDVAYAVIGGGSGSLSAERTLTEGLAIDFTDGGANSTYTLAFDPTELTGNRTWAAGGAASVVWTWDNSGTTDPTFTFGDGLISTNSGFTLATGKNLTIGTTQLTTGDKVDGTKVAAADLGDVSVSAAGAWTIDSAAVVAAKIGTDAVNDTHIDWGTGTNQVSLDDVPDGSSYEKVAAADVASGHVTRFYDSDGSSYLSFTGVASTARAKTVRDADDTLLELGGTYTPTGTWNWGTASVTWPTFNQNTSGTAAGLSGTPNITVGTIGAGAGGFAVDADGDVTGKSFTTAKTSGTPGTNLLYEANSTDTTGTGWMGPASVSANTYYQFNNAAPAANNGVMAFATKSGDTSAQSWIYLDDSGTNGDTGKFWSADKSYDEIVLKATKGGDTYTGTHNFASATVRIPSGTTLPATCAVGDQFMDTDATTGQRYYLCESSNTWALQGDGTGAGATVDDTAMASSWNGVASTAPSKNAVYDWAHLFDTDDDGKVNVLDLASAELVKVNASGVVANAAAGTDYVAPGGALGTPSSGTLTNATGLPISTGVSGLGLGVATALGNAVNGTGGVVTYGNASGAAAVLTGLTATAGALSATDSILVAFGKLVYLLTLSDGQVFGRYGGAYGGLAIDGDLSSVSTNDDTVASAKGVKAVFDARILAPSDDPDVASTGAQSFDTDGWERVYTTAPGASASQKALARVQEEIHVTVVKPQDMADGVRDAFLVWSNESGMTFTITGWKGWSQTDDTTLNIEETDADGANNATVDAVELATNGTGVYTGADTTITGATIENGHLLWLDFDDTDDPAQVKLVIYGYYNADVN